jgi:hypothetical protein
MIRRRLAEIVSGDTLNGEAEQGRYPRSKRTANRPKNVATEKNCREQSRVTAARMRSLTTASGCCKESTETTLIDAEVNPIGKRRIPVE